MSGQDYNNTTDNFDREDATSASNNNSGSSALGMSTDNHTFASASDASLSAVAKNTLNNVAAAVAAAETASSPVITQENTFSSVAPPPPSSSTNSSYTAASTSPLNQQSQAPQSMTPTATTPTSSTTTTTTAATKTLSPKQPPMNQYGSSSAGVSDLKLRRFLEHNQRLREQLEMRRIPVSEAGQSLIQYVTGTRDSLLPMVWGAPDPDPFASPSKGCCTIS